MADFNQFGMQNAEEFSLDNSSALEDFLNGATPSLEKIDPKKEKEKEQEKQTKEVSKPSPAAPKKELKEDEKEEEEEPLDILNALEEAEEPSPKKDKTPEKEAESTEDNAEDNHFEIISQQLYDMGIFQAEDEQDAVLASSGEELAQLFQQNAQRQAFKNLDAFLRSRGEDRMDLFEAVFVNGVDPKEYLPVYNQLQNFQELDMTIETNQEKVYREYYKRLDWDPNKIESRLQKIKDYGDLQEEAEEMHSKIIEQDQASLKQQEETKKAQEAQKKQAEQAYTQTVQKVVIDALKAKELKGIPMTEAMGRNLFAYLTEPRYKLPNGDLITEYDKMHLESKRPENIETRALIALLTLNKFDFSKIEKKAISKETNALFSELKKKSVKQQSQKTAQKQDDFWSQL